MELIQGSAVISFVLLFCRYIKTVWNESVTKKVLHFSGNGLAVLFRNSAVITFFRHDGKTYGIFLESSFFRFFDWLFNLIPRKLSLFYLVAGDVLRESKIFKFIAFLAGNTHICTGIFVAILLITPHSYWNNAYSLLGTVLLTILFFIDGMVNKSRVSTRYFGAYLLVFALCVVLGFVFSLNARLSLRFFLFYVSAFLLVLLVVSSIKTLRELRTMVLIVLTGLFIAALYGCYQSVVGVPVVISQIDLDSSAGTPGRIFSFFDNPNNFGEIIIMLAPLYFAAFFDLKGVKNKLYIVVMFLPAAFSMLMTYMRFGWVGFAFCVLVFLFFKNWRFLPLCIILGLIAIPLLPKSIYIRLFSMFNLEDSSIKYRAQILETMWPPLRDNWFTGVGLGSDIVMRVTDNYELVTKITPVHIHNLYLQIWIEAGFLAIIAFIAAVWRNIKEALTAIFNKDTPAEIKNYIAASVSGMAGILLVSFAEYVWFYPRVMMIFWLLFAISAVSVKLAHQSVQAEKSGDDI